MRVKLGEANSARLTLCVLRPLRRFMLNLAKLSKANFAHKKCRRAYFAGLLCEVTLHCRNVAEIALQCLLCLYFYLYIFIFIFLLAGFKGQRCKAYFARFNFWRAYFARLTLRG
jgi:hypothetical protein